ncbi:MAG: acyl carrier protein [Oscillospiraceae bacterium]|jgi:acyl carrier protein|nr:acyl carrier protein [Oscillospiraceae bacterium]MCR5649401.1 acyl carrier protein [Oscillospiraceae bacterium]
MIFEKLQKMLAEQFLVDEDSITMDTAFVDDLNADSLDLVELSMAVEEEFGLPEIEEEEIANLVTVGDVVRYISSIIE